MSTTAIEWTDRVWNPVTGCTKVSPGCKHCYAEGVAHRFWATQYPAVEIETGGPAGTMSRARKFTDVLTHEDRLLEPLAWQTPARIFVNSMSDLFHEDVPDQFIVDVFGIMALAHWHTFQVLTKRPYRMRDFLAAGDHGIVRQFSQIQRGGGVGPKGMFRALDIKRRDGVGWQWPLPNVWLGVSVEDQDRADERIPLLLQTPAAVRFISAEPLLGPLNFRRCGGVGWCRCQGDDPYTHKHYREAPHSCARCSECQAFTGLDWVIVGGESGPDARFCDVAWARSIVQRCQAAGVPVFVKQLGAHIKDRNDVGFEGDKPGGWPMDTQYKAHGHQHQGDPVRVLLRSKKGGDPAEWPEDLRVREFPR